MRLNPHWLPSTRGLQVDLILLDIQLAGEMDGIGFAKAFRAKGRQEPIIAITAYAMTGDKERIIEAGCNEYLPKPLPIAEFLTMLAKYDPALKTMELPEPPPSSTAIESPKPAPTPTPTTEANAENQNSTASVGTSPGNESVDRKS